MAQKIRTTGWLSEKDASERLGVSITLLRTWRRKGLLKPFRQGSGGEDLYDPSSIQRIRETAAALAPLGIPDPVHAVVNRKIPVRWMTEILGISRQRIYQIRPGTLTVDNAIFLLQRKAGKDQKLNKALRVLRNLKESGRL